MSRGRPREFDTDSALDEALRLFARVGFEQASVQDLANAMGICKPSLYAAFGNKETLFIEAIRRYAAQTDAHHRAILDAEPTSDSAIRALLEDRVRAYTSGAASPGCLVVAEAASAQSAYSNEVRNVIAEVMGGGSALLRTRLQRAAALGELPVGTDVEALTGYFGTVLAGLSVQARNGATADELHAVVRMAMCAWPTAATRFAIASASHRSLAPD